MKKIIYAILFAMATSFAVTACTEEEVKPNSELDSAGGGAGAEEVKKN
jgi:hypothetical protein